MIKQNSKLITILHVTIILIGFVNSIITDDITFNAFESLPFFKNFQYKIITMPELYIVMIILLSYSIFLYLYEYISKKKVAKEPETGDGTKNRLIFILNIIVIFVSVIFVLLSSLTLITTKSNDIPEVSDGVYLDVHDFGIDDKITDTGYSHGNEYFKNKITHKKTLTAQMWLTHEHYDTNDSYIYIFQDVIEYKSQKTALYATELLLSDKYENYSKLNADGFDLAYSGDESFIAVIDSTVYRVAIITTDESLVPPIEELLEKILSNNK